MGDAAKKVVSEAVGSKQIEDRFVGRSSASLFGIGFAIDAEEMAFQGNQAPEMVRFALYEKAERQMFFAVDDVGSLQGKRVRIPLELVDVNALAEGYFGYHRRATDVVRVAGSWGVGSEKFTAQRQQV